MAHHHSAPKSSSSNGKAYCGETKLSTTDYKYIWIIKDYAKFDFGNTGCIKSPTFVSILESIRYPWTLWLFPKNSLVSQGHYRSVILLVPTAKSPKSFKIRCNLLDSKGALVDLNNLCSYNFQESPEIQLGPEQRLRECLQNGNLTLIIEMFFQNSEKTSGPTQIESSDTVSEPEHSLLQFDGFESLLTSGKFSDITLVVGKQNFHVHKNILSVSSPVFCAMFEHEMQEQLGEKVEIPDIEPAVMYELLRFIYTGKVQSSDKLDSNLLLAANKYGIHKLKEACETMLIRNLNLDNLGDVLAIASLCVPTKLLCAVTNFLKSNSEILKNDEKLEKIMSQLPSSLLAQVVCALVAEF